MKSCHFYVSFNPLFNENRAYKTQAHEFHDCLKKAVIKNDQNHFYWGKILVSEYSEPLVVENYQKALARNRAAGEETHLYVSDYQHLWVGKVSEVLKDIPDKENTLTFYKDKKVELWFKITDFDLVSDTTEETLKRLKNLFVDNEFYSYKLNEMAASTSGIRFPMIVQDRSQERFFNPIYMTSGHRVLEDNKLIEDPKSPLKQVYQTQSFVIPEENFKRLPESVKSRILEAEMLLLESQKMGERDRPKLELAVLTYLRALEIFLNETFVAHLRKEEGYSIFVTKNQPLARFIRTIADKDRTNFVSLRDSQELFNISQIKMLLDTPSYFQHTSLDYIFRTRKKFWEYCRLELRGTLKNESLIELRNALEEQGKVTIHDRELLLVRNILLGVGGRGIFNEIIEAYYEVKPAMVKAA